MIIAFALGIIGAILVLANHKYLRKFWIALAAFILTVILALAGVYFILHASKETDSRLFFPIFTPLAALCFLQITRRIYKKHTQKEIILFMRGLFPVRQEERYVTKMEINITFVLLLFSILVPYIILIILL